MNFEVRLAIEAEQTYDAIVEQLLEKWGEKIVGNFKQKTIQALKTLSTSPYIYAVIDENTEIRKCVLHKNCSLIYKIYGHTVLVICFWDNRQEPLFNL